MVCKPGACFNCPYPDCINDSVYDAEYHRKWWEKHREEMNARKRQVRTERNMNGLCRYCEKPLAPNSKTMCVEHLLVERKRAAEKRRRKGVTPRVLFGVTVCHLCGSDLNEGNNKLCESCLAKARNNMMSARAARTVDAFRRTNKKFFRYRRASDD